MAALWLRGTQRAASTLRRGMSLRKVSVEAGEPLRLEIEAFLDAVRTGRSRW